MKSKKTVLIIILAFAVLMAGATVLYNRLGADMAPSQLATQPPATEAPVPEATEVPGETLPEPQIVPDFTVFDIDGNEVHLHDFLGKPIVLNFWASWCGPCMSEMPDFNEKYQELGEEVQFLMVNMTDGGRETVEAASGFVADQGYSFPVFYDSAQHAAYVYSVYSLPTTFFIDAEGYPIAYAAGAISADNLQQGIDLIR